MAQITSSTVAGYFSEDWLSSNSIYQDPAVFNRYIQMYGEAGKLLYFLRMAGSVINISNDTMTFYKEGSWQRSIVTGAEIGTSVAGATLSLTLQADQYDANDDCYLQLYDSVDIPAKYTGGIIGKKYQVTTIGGSAPNYTFTLKPFDDTSAITVAIPAATELMVGAGAYGRGTGQPGGRVSYEYSDTAKTQIVKSSCKFEGGIPAFKLLRETLQGGGGTTLARGLEKTMFDHDARIENVILLGEENGNAITQTNTRDSSSRTVTGTKGVLKHMEDDAQPLPYTDNFIVSDFDAVKALLESQQLTERNINVFHGSNYGRRLENAMLQFVSDVSSSDMIKNARQLNYPIRTLYKNGCYFNFAEMDGWSNPATYGISNYAFKDLALFFPKTQASVKTEKGGQSIMLNNLTLAI
jgi:hypothetical protein